MSEELCPIEVLVAHRWTLFREGLVGLIRHSWPKWSVAEASNYSKVLELSVKMPVQLSILDCNLEGLDAPVGIARLTASDASQRVVVLADVDGSASVLDCLKAGACGYISASATPMQFVACIETVLAGGVFMPRMPASTEPGPLDCQNQTSVRFTGRQQDVLRLLGEGCSTKTIARRLGLSSGTVKVHLASIFRALSVHSRLEAVIKARDLLPVGAGSDMGQFSVENLGQPGSVEPLAKPCGQPEFLRLLRGKARRPHPVRVY